MLARPKKVESDFINESLRRFKIKLTIDDSTVLPVYNELDKHFIPLIQSVCENERTLETNDSQIKLQTMLKLITMGALSPLAYDELSKHISPQQIDNLALMTATHNANLMALNILINCLKHGSINNSGDDQRYYQLLLLAKKYAQPIDDTSDISNIWHTKLFVYSDDIYPANGVTLLVSLIPTLAINAASNSSKVVMVGIWQFLSELTPKEIEGFCRSVRANPLMNSEGEIKKNINILCVGLLSETQDRERRKSAKSAKTAVVPVVAAVSAEAVKTAAAPPVVVAVSAEAVKTAVVAAVSAEAVKTAAAPVVVAVSAEAVKPDIKVEDLPKSPAALSPDQSDTSEDEVSDEEDSKESDEAPLKIQDSSFSEIKKLLETQLDALDAKREALAANKDQAHQAAAKAAKDCLDALRPLANDYFKKKIDYAAFQSNSLAAIQSAKPTLDRYCGCKKILSNIGLAIAGLGIFYAVAGLINLAVTGKFLFFKTSTTKKLDDIKKTILTTPAI